MSKPPFGYHRVTEDDKLGPLILDFWYLDYLYGLGLWTLYFGLLPPKKEGEMNNKPRRGGGYPHTLPIQVFATQRGRDFEALDVERGIHFRGVF